jgi:hypothetical protein
VRRLVACLLALGLLLGTAAADANAASLSVKRARTAAYKLTRKIGAREGASYALAGYCKRKSSRRVNCWGAIIFGDGSAVAQRIKVVRRRKVRASVYGRVLSGNLTDDGGGGGGANEEWAVCTPSGQCVGS